jgi:hypothetical protein
MMEKKRKLSEDSDQSDAASTGGGSPDEFMRTGMYATDVRPFDVLLGRGTGPSMNPGNVHFRDTVESLKQAYIATPSRKVKKTIVHKIVRDIDAKNGRFLNKLTKRETKMLGISPKVLYEVVPNTVALEKTKQAIRYIHYKKNSNRKKRLTEQLKRMKRDVDIDQRFPDFERISVSPRLTPRAAVAPGLADTMVPPFSLNASHLTKDPLASLTRFASPRHQLQMMASLPLSSPLISSTLLGQSVHMTPPLIGLSDPTFQQFTRAPGAHQSFTIPPPLSLPAGIDPARLSDESLQQLSRLTQERRRALSVSSSLSIPVTQLPVSLHAGLDSIMAAEANIRLSRAMASLAAKKKLSKPSPDEAAMG